MRTHLCRCTSVWACNTRSVIYFKRRRKICIKPENKLAPPNFNTLPDDYGANNFLLVFHFIDVRVPLFLKDYLTEMYREALRSRNVLQIIIIISHIVNRTAAEGDSSTHIKYPPCSVTRILKEERTIARVSRTIKS